MVRAIATSTLLYQPVDLGSDRQSNSGDTIGLSLRQVYLALLKDGGHAVFWYAWQWNSRGPVTPRHSHSEHGTCVCTGDKTEN